MIVFFTDRNLGKRFPEILAAAGLEVRRHADHFAHDAPDEDWLQAVGQNGWVAITHDGRIRYKPNELATVKECGVRLLVVIGAAAFPALAKHFVDTAAKVEQFVNEGKPPFIAKVYRPSAAALIKNPNAPGSVVHWCP